MSGVVGIGPGWGGIVADADSMGRMASFCTVGPDSSNPVHQARVRSVMEYRPLVWMGAAPTGLEKLDTIQDKAVD